MGALFIKKFAPLIILRYKYIMKRLFGSIVLISLAMPVFALPSEVITLDKKNLEKPEIYTGETKQVIKGTLLLNDSEDIASLNFLLNFFPSHILLLQSNFYIIF